MSDTGRYRKLFTHIWRRPEFKKLPITGKQMAFYVLFGPQTNRIGLFYFSIKTAADDLNLSVHTCATRVRDLSVTFGWLFDADAKVFYIPSWWKWNRPQNPSVLAHILSDLNEIPPCALTEAFARNLDWLPDTCHDTFLTGVATRLGRRVGSRVPNQDQDQDQEQEQDTGAGAECAPRAADTGAVDVRRLRLAEEALRHVGNHHDTSTKIDHIQDYARRKNVEIGLAEARKLLAIIQARRKAG